MPTMTLLPSLPTQLTTQQLWQSCVVLVFAFTVCGQLWSWPLALFLCTKGIYVAALMLVYIAYIWGPGFKAAQCAESWPTPLRRWSIWKTFAEYFNMKLVKTADLDPNQHYLFIYHPHGISAFGAWAHFITKATDFSSLYPGLEVFGMTLDGNFKSPFIREYCLLSGLRSAGRRALQNLLTAGKPGQSVVLVPGGAAESLLVSPGTMDLVLSKRKGFVKVALETGARLVPVITFGENDAFHTYIAKPGSWQEKAMKSIKRRFGFATPLFWGVGCTGTGLGIMPHRVQLTTVVGAPLDLPPLPSGLSLKPGVLAPGCESAEYLRYVDEVHSKYLAALQELYDKHKDAYAPCRRRSMCIVE